MTRFIFQWQKNPPEGHKTQLLFTADKMVKWEQRVGARKHGK